jgi:hypothetical protein
MYSSIRKRLQECLHGKVIEVDGETTHPPTYVDFASVLAVARHHFAFFREIRMLPWYPDGNGWQFSFARKHLRGMCVVV